MFKYANDALSNYICTNLHTFWEQKCEHWIKPGSKFLVHIDDLFLSLHKSEIDINSEIWDINSESRPYFLAIPNLHLNSEFTSRNSDFFLWILKYLVSAMKKNKINLKNKKMWLFVSQFWLFSCNCKCISHNLVYNWQFWLFFQNSEFTSCSSEYISQLSQNCEK